MKRILMVMDVSEAEAKVLADHLEDLGPEYKGYGFKQAIADALHQYPDGEVLHVSIRTRGSIALGGPDTPDFKEK